MSYCVILVGIHGLFRMCFMEKFAQVKQTPCVWNANSFTENITHYKIIRFAVL